MSRPIDDTITPRNGADFAVVDGPIKFRSYNSASDLPAPSAFSAGTYVHVQTPTHVLYFTDGSSWNEVQGGAGGGAVVADDVVALRALPAPSTDGTPIALNGYYAAGDGGGGSLYWDAASTLPDDGGLTFKLAGAATGRARRQVTKGRIDPRQFGAIGDDLSHPLSGFFGSLGAAQTIYPHATSLTNEIDWAAWQAAINATRTAVGSSLFAIGGTVWGSKGVYLMDQPLEGHATLGLTLCGHGNGVIGTGNGNGGSVQLIYTGNTHKRFIDLRSTGSCTLEKLSIGYSSPTWNGDLVDVSHFNAGDTQGFAMRDCMLSGTTAINIVAGQGCRSLLFTGNAISSFVSGCTFGVAKRAIKFREQDGSYANAITVEKCNFVYHNYSLVNAGEAVQINDCIFEGSGGQMLAAYYDEYADVTASDVVTFAFDAGAQTITRSTGSWITDGFIVGMAPYYFAFAGSGVNVKLMNPISALTDTVMTIGAGASPILADAGSPRSDGWMYGTSILQDAASPTTYASPGNALTFDAAASTITRSAGSWLTDNLFFVGMGLNVAATASNNGGLTKLVALDATTLYFGPNNFVFSGHTITRTDGRSFAADGWANDMLLTVAGTSSNNGDYGAVTVSGSTLTVASASFASETTTGTGDLYSLFETRFQARSVGSGGQAFVDETSVTAHIFQSAGGGPISFSGCWMGDQFLPSAWLKFGQASSVKLSACQIIGNLAAAKFRQNCSGFEVDAGCHVVTLQEPFQFRGETDSIKLRGTLFSGAADAITYPANNPPISIDMDCTRTPPGFSPNLIGRSAKRALWDVRDTFTVQKATISGDPGTVVPVLQLVQGGTTVMEAGGFSRFGGPMALLQGVGPLHLQWVNSGPLRIGANGFNRVGIGYGYHNADLQADVVTSQLVVDGAIATSYHPIAADYALDDHDSTVDIDATNGNVTVTLPDATICKGRSYTLGRLDGSGNTVTVTTTNGQTINRAATAVLAAQDNMLTVQSDGANWRVVGRV